KGRGCFRTWDSGIGPGTAERPTRSSTRVSVLKMSSRQCAGIKPRPPATTFSRKVKKAPPATAWRKPCRRPVQATPSRIRTRMPLDGKTFWILSLQTAFLRRDKPVFLRSRAEIFSLPGLAGLPVHAAQETGKSLQDAHTRYHPSVRATGGRQQEC